MSKTLSSTSLFRSTNVLLVVIKSLYSSILRDGLVRMSLRQVDETKEALLLNVFVLRWANEVETEGENHSSMRVIKKEVTGDADDLAPAPNVFLYYPAGWTLFLLPQAGHGMLRLREKLIEELRKEKRNPWRQWELLFQSFGLFRWKRDQHSDHEVAPR